MPFTTNEGARIFWRSQGVSAAPPLVLLHSIGTDMTVHDQVAPLLEQHFLVIRIDLRGHGASDATGGDYSLALHSRDVLAVLDAAHAASAIICGTSLGGMIAMELARLASERITGLVLANTSPAMNPVLWNERIATARAHGLASIIEGWAGRHLSQDYLAANPVRVQTLERAFAAMSPIGYCGNAAAIRDMNVLPHLHQITVPTLVIAGEHDLATPFEGHGSRIAATIPGATVEMLPAGHLACAEQAELFARCVQSLAAQCR